jgi:hypothetical protein
VKKKAEGEGKRAFCWMVEESLGGVETSQQSESEEKRRVRSSCCRSLEERRERTRT